MAEFYLNLPIQYFPDPAKGRPVFNGSVYIGIPDLDPEIEANRVPIVIIEEDGTRVVVAPSAQPLLTSPGGVITYQGSYVSVLIDGPYSIKVNDSIGAQAYYVANVQGTIQPALNDYNLVANGSFEIDSDNNGTPDDWDITTIAGGTVSIDATTRITGSQSLQFISAGGGAGDAVTANFFEVSELRGVQVLFALMSSVANIRNLVQLVWYDSNLSQLSTSTVYDNETTNSLIWADNITNVDVPAFATFAKLQLFGAHPSNPNTGSAWFDNIRVTALASISAISEPTLIATVAPRETGGITGATQANPVVVTQIGHGFTTGDKIYISDVIGMTEINNIEFTITVTGADIYSLGVDGAAYTPYVSGGTGEIDEYILTTVPATAILKDGEIFIYRATSRNKTATPEVDINALGKKIITRQGGNPLGATSIRDAEHDVIIRYSSVNDNYEMLNPYAIPSRVTTVMDGDVSTGTGVIPNDDSIPQITEGDEVMSVSIAPTDAGSKLIIRVIVNAASSLSSSGVVVALFQDTSADALSAAVVANPQTDALRQVILEHELIAISSALTKFTVRIGTDSAATTTFNGEAGARVFGGVMSSFISITEVTDDN